MTDVMSFEAPVIDPDIAELLGDDLVPTSLVSAAATNWESNAKCAKRPEVDFFPMPLAHDVVDADGTTVEAGEEDPNWDPTPALALCASCPVREMCLDKALTDNDTVGVRGGTTEEQREMLRKGLQLLPHGTVSGYNMGCTAGADGEACGDCKEAIAVYWADKRNPIATV